ncbi:unnamed protein product [Ectocarpus sp. 4 AP-2014]
MSHMHAHRPHATMDVLLYCTHSSIHTLLYNHCYTCIGRKKSNWRVEICISLTSISYSANPSIGSRVSFSSTRPCSGPCCSPGCCCPCLPLGRVELSGETCQI